MSMKDIACSGHVIKASDLTKILPDEMQKEYTAAIEDQNWELVGEILDGNIPTEFPPFESVFVHSDEDSSDGELDKGEIYVCFDETDLFTKAKTPEMVALEKVGIEPKFVRWTTWG